MLLNGPETNAQMNEWSDRMDDGRIDSGWNGRWTEWTMDGGGMGDEQMGEDGWTDGIDGCFGKLLGNKGSRFRSGRKTLWVISITFQNQRNA